MRADLRDRRSSHTIAFRLESNSHVGEERFALWPTAVASAKAVSFAIPSLTNARYGETRTVVPCQIPCVSMKSPLAEPLRIGIIPMKCVEYSGDPGTVTYFVTTRQQSANFRRHATHRPHRPAQPPPSYRHVPSGTFRFSTSPPPLGAPPATSGRAASRPSPSSRTPTSSPSAATSNATRSAPVSSIAPKAGPGPPSGSPAFTTPPQSPAPTNRGHSDESTNRGHSGFSDRMLIRKPTASPHRPAPSPAAPPRTIPPNRPNASYPPNSPPRPQNRPPLDRRPRRTRPTQPRTTPTPLPHSPPSEFAAPE